MLLGLITASRPPVTVNGSFFIMEGGSVEESRVDIPNWFGGGVNVLNGGTIIINEGIVAGNRSASGAGVNVGENCTLIMNGGKFTINFSGDGNRFSGGNAVYVNGVFTMVDGYIYGNGYDGK